MIIDTANCKMVCQNVSIHLAPVTFAFAAWIARQQKTSQTGQQCVHWQSGDWSAYADEYAAIPGISSELVVRMKSRFTKQNDKGILDEDRKAFFYEHLSRLRKEMRKQLGALFSRYNPVTRKKRGKSGVQFPLEEETILFA
jgi:hypothetical protein